MLELKKTITAPDLRNHHINKRPYATDVEYAKVAKTLQKMIFSLCGGKYITHEVAKDLAVRLTLHLEDTVADAGVWRGFCIGHHRLYGKWLPFQWNDDDMPLDEVTEQSCAFIIWMTLTSFDSMRYTSPLMPAVNALGREVYEYLNGVFDDMPINDEMLHDIYSDDVLGDFYKMRDVLSWLTDAEGCYMSYWDVTAEGARQELESYRRYIKRQDKYVQYQVSSTLPFKEKVRPLAVLSNEWYVDMLEGFTEQDRKDYAKVLRDVKIKRFDAYHIENLKSGIFTMQGEDGDVFEVPSSGFGLGIEDWDESKNLVLTSFAYYNGKWETTGIYSFQHTDEDFEKMLKAYAGDVEQRKREIELYQKFIDKNNGQRIYYFHSFDEFTNWHDGIAKSKEGLFDGFPDDIKRSNEILVYLPTNGGMELADGCCYPLCDRNNPFYDEERSKSDSIDIIDTDALRGENVRYMISHGMLKNFSFAGGDPIVSHNVAQENLDFLLRYYHRGLY